MLFTIPKEKKYVDNEVFEKFRQLTHIKVEQGNQAYTSVDGVLFSKYMTELHAYPACRDADSYEIHEGVRKIWHKTFAGAHNLKNIKIPGSVSFIGATAFESCSGITEINMPAVLMNDNHRMLYGCCNLERISIEKGRGSLKSVGRFIENRTIFGHIFFLRY